MCAGHNWDRVSVVCRLSSRTVPGQDDMSLTAVVKPYMHTCTKHFEHVSHQHIEHVCVSHNEHVCLAAG